MGLPLCDPSSLVTPGARAEFARYSHYHESVEELYNSTADHKISEKRAMKTDNVLISMNIFYVMSYLYNTCPQIYFSAAFTKCV